MEKSIKWLAGLLILQLILTVLVYSRDARNPADMPGKLLPELTAVDQLLIEDGSSRVRLQRAQDQWILPDSDNFPATSSQITRLLENLSEIRGNLPVATTDAAQTRLQVARDAFQRRLVFKAGDIELATLYVGTSPGLRQSHVRLAGHEAIVIAPIEVHQLSAQPADWEDKRVLQFSSDQVHTIQVAGLSISRQPQEAADQPGTWHSQDPDLENSLDQHGVGALLSQLATLHVAGYAGREADPDWGLETPALELTLSLHEGTQRTYVLGESSKNEFYLKVSHRPEYFRLMKHTASNLIQAARREALIDNTTGNNDESG